MRMRRHGLAGQELHVGLVGLKNFKPLALGLQPQALRIQFGLPDLRGHAKVVALTFVDISVV